MESFSCKQGVHTLSPGANSFTFFTISHLMLKLMFLAFNFQTLSLSVVEVLLCSNLKDDLCKLNLVLKSFSVSSIHVSWLFEGVSVTAALYTTHLARHSLFSRHEFFFVFFFPFLPTDTEFAIQSRFFHSVRLPLAIIIIIGYCLFNIRSTVLTDFYCVLLKIEDFA